MISGIESAKLKIERATVHIKTIQAHGWEYTSRQPDVIVKEPNGKPKPAFTEQPPPDISIIAGEVVYQLRSALDHLAFDLVKLNPMGANLPASWEKRCEFPLLTEIPANRTYNFFNKTLPGITAEAFTVIESLQPYNGGNGCTELGWLAQLSNIDKHRHLHLVGPHAYQREHLMRLRVDSETIRLEQGAEIETSPPTNGAMYVNAGVFHSFVSFDESVLGEDAAAVSVDYLLQLCADTITAIVIPAFEKLIKNG